MGRVIIVTLFFKIRSEFALCNENQKHRIIASMHAAQIYKFHDRLEVDGELSTCIRRVKNTYAPLGLKLFVRNKICRKTRDILDRCSYYHRAPGEQFLWDEESIPCKQSAKR